MAAIVPAQAARPLASRLGAAMLSRPAVVFTLSVCAVIVLLGNLVMNVPVMIPMLPDSEDQSQWPVAAGAALFVAAVAGPVTLAAVRRRVRGAAEPGVVGPRRPLRLEVAPPWAVWLTGLGSFGLFLAGAIYQLKDWQTALVTLVPWLPVLTAELVHRYRIDGLYAFFLLVSLLQVGHLGEHSAQVAQLVMHNGNLDRSHGVFGELDFETVHFFWDTAIWLIAAALLYRYTSNGWLWLSFGFASLHEVEHMYLYWTFLVDYSYYMKGALAGIMGKGGVIGSPLFRPYLHFFYNFLVTVPMVIGLWMEKSPERAPAEEAA